MTDSSLVDTSTEVHNRPSEVADCDDESADASLKDEVVAASFAVVYDRSSAAFDPKELALADLNQSEGILIKLTKIINK